MIKVQASVAARPPGPGGVLGESVELSNHFHVESYADEATVYRPEDPADRIYLLRSGRVRLMRPGGVGADGVVRTESVHALLRPGDLFGDALRPHDATMDEFAVAQGEIELWSIAGKDLRALVESRPPLALEIIRGLNDRVRNLRRRVNALTFKEVPARLAETVLTLGETHGTRCAHGGELDLRGVTQQDLADLVGASRSFVSTLINELKRDGVLGNVGRTLCIRNSRDLKNIAARDRL